MLVVQTLLLQSDAALQTNPGAHVLSCAVHVPPQSVSLSSWFLIPSLHVCATVVVLVVVVVVAVVTTSVE